MEEISFLQDANQLAFAEIEETELLEKLKALLKAEKTIVCPVDEGFLLLFLRYRKHNLENTVAAIVANLKYLKTESEFHSRVIPSVLAPHFESKILTTLRFRDRFGRQVVLARVKNWDPEKTPFTWLCSLILGLELHILRRQLTQKHGIVYLIDLHGMLLSLPSLFFRHIAPSIEKMTKSSHTSMLAMLKGVHFVNHSKTIQLLWAFVRRFLKPKLRERVYFHSDFLSLYSYLPPEILSKQYGGNLDDHEFEEPNFLEGFLQSERYFQDWFNPQAAANNVLTE